MTDVTRILQAVDADDHQAANELLSLVYDELRQLAAVRLSKEPDQSLIATDLVHEAYLRLFGGQKPNFRNRSHFFGAAAEAMRRVLIDCARRRLSKKRGGNLCRVDLDPHLIEETMEDEKLLRLQDALEKLEDFDAERAQLVKLRFFVGLPIREVADILGISTATADRHWRFIRAWLQREMNCG